MSRLSKFPPVRPSRFPADFWSYDQSAGEVRRWIQNGNRPRNHVKMDAIRTANLNDMDGLVRSFDLVFAHKGYSGFGRGFNNPALQHVQGVGPIPRGWWYMRDIYDSKRVGPRAITLWSLEDDTFDDRVLLANGHVRSAFRIHGDNRLANNTGSRGCIILPRKVRLAMWNSGIPFLRVVE